MTLVNGIYFFSMIITSILMASIAWFSWHNRERVNGTVIYTVISALSSFMCLCEFFIMLSHSASTALLWFNLRFITFAFAPVLWFLFSLYYTGREYIIPGRKVIVLFIVPAITQAAVLTSPYHSFWIKHEVEFYKSGLFMFANTAVRESGPWMKVHFSHSYLFMTAGLIILLYFSFRMKSKQRRQAITIGTGTLLMLLGSLYPAFNLIPGMSANIMQISIAIGTLIISWGIYRYRFLSESPVIDKNQPIPVPLVLLFSALTILIITLGYNNYSRYRESQKKFIDNELSSIADLKVTDILNWRNERISDGNTLCGNRAFIDLAENYIYNRNDQLSKNRLLSWLERIKESYRYDNILFTDLKGKKILSIPETPQTFDSDWPDYISKNIHNEGAYLTDLHGAGAEGKIHLSVIAPLKRVHLSGPLIGYVVMIIDPEKYLYPFIRRWPGQSESAETLIVRRDGDDILYLNELRFNKTEPLSYRIKISEANVPAVKAVLGYEGITEGIDYRGKNVVASLRHITGSSWYLVSKIDAAEVFGPIRTRFIMMVIMIVAFVSTVVTVFGYLWRRQSENFYRREYESSLKLRESEKKLREAQQMARLGYWEWDVKTGDVTWSDEVYKIFGLDRDRFTPQIDSILELSPWPEDHKRDNELINRAIADHSQGSYEQRFLRPDNSSGYYFSTFQGVYEENGNLISIKGTVLDITERKLFEIALLESEQRFRNALENIPAVITIYDKNLRIQYINKATSSITGLSADEIIGRCESDIWPEDVYSRWMPALKKTLETGKTQSIETEIIMPGNNIHYVYIVCVPLLNEDGTLREIIGITHDLTERKNYENLLKEKETIFNSLLEFSPVYIFFKDHNIRPVYLSRNYEKMIGMPLENIIGKTMDELFPSDLSKSMIADDLKIIQNDELVETDEDLNGRFYYTVKFPVKIEGKDPMLAGFTLDITERKLATDLLKIRLELINFSSEHSLHELIVKILDEFERFTSSRIGFFHFVDDDQKSLTLQTWSSSTVDKFCTAYGQGLHYNISDAGVWVDCIYSRGPVIHNDYASLEHKKGLPNGHAPVSRELVIPVIRDGKIKAILGVGNKPDNYNKSDISVAEYFSGIAWDIVEKKIIGDNLKQLNADLEERVNVRTAELAKANSELESFSYSVSHDLRAPIRHITGFLDMLNRDTESALSAKGAHYIDVINESAKKMMQLIDDLLAFSRMGRAALVIQPVDMDSLLEDVLAEFSSEIKNSGASIVRHKLPVIPGDRSMLRIALVNLISNSVKFTSKTPSPLIEIGCETGDSVNTFYFKDNGAGFDMQYAEKLFGVFQRMHSDKDFPGTGIGLATVRNIIERHNGTVRAESETGRGTSIFFTIPLNIDDGTTEAGHAG